MASPGFASTSPALTRAQGTREKRGEKGLQRSTTGKKHDIELFPRGVSVFDGRMEWERILPGDGVRGEARYTTRV